MAGNFTIRSIQQARGRGACMIKQNKRKIEGVAAPRQLGLNDQTHRFARRPGRYRMAACDSRLADH